MSRRAVLSCLALLLVTASLAGCASVPENSPVQVLRQLTGGDDNPPPLGPTSGSDPLGLVRDFVTASGSSTDKHGAARRFLSPEAQTWDDTASLTVLDGQIDTVPAPGAADPKTNATTIRIRGLKVGVLTPAGSFEPDQATFQLDVDVVRRDGEWRISRLPDGVVVALSVFRENYRPVPIWFLDPVRRAVVPDLRYVPAIPARAQAARVVDLVLLGPSAAAHGAAVSELDAKAKLRSNVAVSNDGVLVVDLTKVGDLDPPSRQLLAAQLVLSLAEVNVSGVRLSVDGEPLVAGKPDWSRDDVDGLSAEVPTPTTVPALLTSGGKVAQISGSEPVVPLLGPFGNGSYSAESAGSTVDGKRIAVVAKSGTGRILLVSGGTEAGVAPVPLSGATMSRPTWNPTGTEVWTVVDSTTIARVTVDDTGNIRPGQVNDDELAGHGPITDLRMSRDGMRVAAVVGGGLYTAVVVRGADGEVAIRNVRRLRPDLGEVVAVDWRASEFVVVITRTPEHLVMQVSADGLWTQAIPSTNLTPPLTAIAAAPNRPLLVTDQGGVWSFAGSDQDEWKLVPGAGTSAVPGYPG